MFWRYRKEPLQKSVSTFGNHSEGVEKTTTKCARPTNQELTMTGLSFNENEQSNAASRVDVRKLSIKILRKIITCRPERGLGNHRLQIEQGFARLSTWLGLRRLPTAYRVGFCTELTMLFSDQNPVILPGGRLLSSRI